MATIAAVIASPTTRSTTARARRPGQDRPPFADEWVAKIEAFRETLTRARPDVLVMVGSDHFHQLWLDNMPQFLVGKAPVYDANWYNEEREFGLPRMLLQGDEELSGAPAPRRPRRGLRPGVQQRAAHRSQHHLPDHHAAASGGPADRARLHQHLRAAAAAAQAVRRSWARRSGQMVESWPSDQRVAIIGTGHLSLELGGPRQFGPHGPDPEFDRKAVSGSPPATWTAAWPRSAWTACGCPATRPTGSWTSC